MNGKVASNKLQVASKKLDPRSACGLRLEARRSATPLPSSELRVPSSEFGGLNPKRGTRNPKLQPRFAASGHTLRPSPFTLHSQKGFSLIELLVSMVIGLFILAGVMYVMANSRKNYETTDYTARLQENARFALHYLGYDLRNAGFSGCSDYQAWDVAPAILGENPGSELSTAYGDRIRIEYADPNSTLTGSIDTNGYVTVSVPAHSWVFVSDCAKAEVLENTSDTSTDLTTSKTFSPGYEIRPLVSHRYYVAPTTSGGDFGVLCREVQKGAVNDPGTSASLACTGISSGSLERTDLVQGIEYLRVLYGEDTDSDGIANEYRDQATVGNWNAVVAVQLGMVVRSVSNYRPDINPNREFGADRGGGGYDEKTYRVLDKVIKPEFVSGKCENADVGAAQTLPCLRVARRVITETIQIRNAVMSSSGV